MLITKLGVFSHTLDPALIRVQRARFLILFRAFSERDKNDVHTILSIILKLNIIKYIISRRPKDHKFIELFRLHH